MRNTSGHAPAWLFAFVDLAFLLLIAMTQLGASPDILDVGDMVLPRIGDEMAPELARAARDLWQLRVHPPAEATEPFELGMAGEAGARVGAEQLRTRLGELHAASEAKPLLAPHADSRSQDFLSAVELLEEIWPSRRRAAVERVFPRR